MTRNVLIVVALILLFIATASFAAGYLLGHPYRRTVNPPPSDLRVEQVSFPSASGAKVSGWLLNSANDDGVIVLMHGVRATRSSMVRRARLLQRAGYDVLLFDFQAHGETDGDVISFGVLESRDAAAAISFVRTRFPGQPVGVIGSSLGGAAVLLAESPLDIDALIIEAVYPTIEEAVENRLRMRGGSPAAFVAPLLLLQLKPRLGLTPEDLRPIDRIDEIDCPVLIINGTRDRHTTPEQARALYARAREPKSLWLVEGAGHIDMDTVASYEDRILAFFAQHLGRAEG